MSLSWIDIAMFVVFIISVITVGIVKSRKEKTSEDYFLAGRGLTWWLIGFSLIAANISTEQFVGMSGNAASHVGLAIASYEWMAAITLVVVAFGFLPYFLRAGIFTMPQFLEYRYNSTARTIMAAATIFIYMLLLGSVTYSGALTIKTLGNMMDYDISLFTGSIIIGVIAMLYVASGGLKACAWADLLQGSALILGGAIILIFAFDKLGHASGEVASFANVDAGDLATKTFTATQGVVERFKDLNAPRMNMFLPRTDVILPWTALMLGLWIPNFYYWGLNQYITQRTLGSASLSQGQKGIVFASFLKLIIPFVIVIPGIIAFNLYSHNMKLEAIHDNAKVMAKYYMSNGQETKFVEMKDSPEDMTLSEWKSGKFMLAVFNNDSTMKIALKRLDTHHKNNDTDPKADNRPFILPILKKDFYDIELSDYTVYKSDDKAWKQVFPGLAVEIDKYNEKVELEAKNANKKTKTEKFIAYKYDTAMAQLIGRVLPRGTGLFGFILAALLGAVVSSLAAMLNASSTIFTIDVYQKYISPEATQKAMVFVGRACVVIFSFVAVMLAPRLGDPKISNSIFSIIQEGQGFISPGILAVFAFGLLIRKAPPVSGAIGLLTNIVAYGALKLALPQVQFLNRMAICFGLCLLVMALITLFKPLAKPIEFKKQTKMNLDSSRGAKIAGFIVVAIALILYVIFSPIGLAK